MSGAMKLYYTHASPAARAVMLCMEALGLKPEYKYVKLGNKEQLTPEFLKMNPQHTVPTLDDNGFYIWDSHAINAYLVSKYGKNDSLYPRDPQKRAIVDQRLYYDSGVLFPLSGQIFGPLLRGRKEISEENVNNVIKNYDLLEKFLEGQNYIAGSNFTIADFSCVATVSTLVESMGIQTLPQHTHVRNWLQRCKETLPGYSIAQDRGISYLKNAVDSFLERDKSKM